MSAPLLRARGVAVGYRDRTVVADADLDLHAGEVHGLIGPNGAGKSTLLRALAGLAPLRAGRVAAIVRDSVGEVELDLARLAPRARARHLAVLPQDTNADAELTARTVVGLGRYAHRSRLARFRGDLDRDDLAIVAAALERVGAAHLAEARITELSGGQRQLVFIAKQLAQQSRLLLLDEPVSALDLGYQLEVLELLRDLAAEGRGVLVVLHDLNLAARNCDRLTVLAHGRVRATGTPAEVLRAHLLDELYGIESVVAHDPLTSAPRIAALRRRRPGIPTSAAGPLATDTADPGRAHEGTR